MLAIEQLDRFFDNFDWRALLHVISSRAIAALLIAILGYWVARLASKGLDRIMRRAHVEDTARQFLRNLTYVALLVIVFTISLQTLGVSPASLIAVLGAAGLGIGLALKDSLSNIASGVMLIVQRPFRVGDVVQVAGQEGRVSQVRIFVTYLRTLDNREVIIPNSLIATQAIVNLTYQATRRVDIALGISYRDDLAKAQQLLLDICAQTPQVLSMPAPEVLVTNLHDANVALELRAWSATADTTNVRTQLISRIHDTFMEQGFEMPLSAARTAKAAK